MSRISIAMATFNGERHLPALLESLGVQKFRPYELVICDDRSNDGTLNIIQTYTERLTFPVFHVVNDVRLGYRENFLKAATLCSGDVVSFCDQDDIWDSLKLEAVDAEFSRDPLISLVYHNASILDRERIVGRLYGANHSITPKARKGADIIFSPLGFTISFRRNLLGYSGLHSLSRDPNSPDQNEAHDQWIYFLAQNLSRFTYLQADLVQYRQHQTNVHGWGNRPVLRRFIENCRRAKQRQNGLRVCAARRLRILSIISETESLDKRLAVREAIESYQTLSRILIHREDIYTGTSVRQRLSKVLWMLREGYYSQAAGEYSLRTIGFLRDFALITIDGVLFKDRCKGGRI